MNIQPIFDLQPMFKRDAIGLLKKEHRRMQALFTEFEAMKESGSASERFEIARKVCGDLLIHMAVEEAIFYPEVRRHIGDDSLMNQAAAEHDGAKDLIRQIGDIDPADAMFAAKVSVLAEVIELHIRDEESDMFAKALVSDVDLLALGGQLLAAENEMRINLGLEPEK